MCRLGLRILAMDNTRNKPRVFLSHSKADKAFIAPAGEDLRRCQIEPWLDSLEIRHGQPWLDAIFESGIPTCDCVLVYFTENSLRSPMVKKEIDAGLLQKLKDNRVAFLPYVAEEAIREKLRSDIRSLQAPVWNGGNYSQLLPQVVAEIWHSYMERVVTASINEERAKRLTAELELERTKKREEAGIFSGSEEKDFGFIHQTLDRFEPVVFRTLRTQQEGKSEQLRSCEFHVNLLSMLMGLVDRRHSGYDSDRVKSFLKEALKKDLPDEKSLPKDVRVTCSRAPEPENELLMFGLLEDRRASESTTMVPLQRYPLISRPCRFVYSEKMHRLRYWLAVKGLLPTGVQWERGSTSDHSNEKEEW